MMKEKLFIVGDLHGEYALLEKLLKHWNEEEETLLFIGDLGDRGPDSKACFLKVMSLVQSGRAVCLSGNHEQILLRWLKDPEERFGNYLLNGGHATLESLFYEGVVEAMSATELAQKVQTEYSELVAFLEGLPLYYETAYCLCVHAGINLDLEDWKATTVRDFVWLREEFYTHAKRLEKIIIFGHTPVDHLHHDKTATHLWYQNGKLGIDGGATFEGALHGVVVSAQGIEADYQVFHPQHQWGNEN